MILSELLITYYIINYMSEEMKNVPLEVEVVQGTEKETGSKGMGTLESLTKILNDFFTKTCPKLPKDILDFFVKNASVLNIVGMVLKGLNILILLPALLTSLVAVTQLSRFGLGIEVAYSILAILVAITGSSIGLYFAFKAQSGLESKKLFSWKNIYLGSLISISFGILYAILTFTPFSIIAFPFLIVFDMIVLYVIFQIRSSFMNK